MVWLLAGQENQNADELRGEKGWKGSMEDSFERRRIRCERGVMLLGTALAAGGIAMRKRENE